MPRMCLRMSHQGTRTHALENVADRRPVRLVQAQTPEAAWTAA